MINQKKLLLEKPKVKSMKGRKSVTISKAFIGKKVIAVARSRGGNNSMTGILEENKQTANLDRLCLVLSRMLSRDIGTGNWRGKGAYAPLDFGRSVNLIQAEELGGGA